VATEDLTRALDEAGAAYELLPHAHTESALAEAQALGLPADDVAKTLIVKTREGYLRAVVPASDRLDERKLRDITDGSKRRFTSHQRTSFGVTTPTSTSERCRRSGARGATR